VQVGLSGRSPEAEAAAPTVHQSSSHTGCRSVTRLKHTQINENRPSTATHGLRCVSGAPFRSLEVPRSAPRSTPIERAVRPGLVNGQRTSFENIK
jgi:hypothetical protein